MKWSFKIGQIAGIGIFIHFTFLLLLAWVVFSTYSTRQSWSDAMDALAFVGSLFGVVVLHELGHALAARRYGIKTRDITLLPIGGVARLERIPEDPRQELVVALAGPAVNVVLAGVFYGLCLLSNTPLGIQADGLYEGSFLARMLWVNVILVVFNMLPAFPMDGGRVLRALLALKLDHMDATRIAAGIGQAMAFLFAFVGLTMHHPMLLFVAFFVWIGAAQEHNMVQMKNALSGIPVRRAMVRDFKTLRPEDTLKTAVQHILDGFQQDFPIVEEGRVVGMLTRADLLKGVSSQGDETPVAQLMQREFKVADPLEMLDRVFNRLQECACHSLPVLQGSELVGILTTDNLTEFLMIQEAMRERGGGKPPRRTLLARS